MRLQGHIFAVPEDCSGGSHTEVYLQEYGFALRLASRRQPLNVRYKHLSETFVRETDFSTHSLHKLPTVLTV